MSDKIASVVCFSISSTPDLAYSNEERGGDEGEVLGEDAGLQGEGVEDVRPGHLQAVHIQPGPV